MKKLVFLLACVAMCGCSTVQSIVASTFPYTTTLVIPNTSPVDKDYSAISTATSFDQNFTFGSARVSKVSKVRIVSARLQAIMPANYNIGNVQSVKLYMAKPDGSGEVLVATRTDIGANIGNILSLDIDNSKLLDDLVHQPSTRVRMEYKLRNKSDLDVSLRVSLSIKAEGAVQ